MGLYHSFISHLFHMMTHFSDAHLGFQKIYLFLHWKEGMNKQTKPLPIIEKTMKSSKVNIRFTWDSKKGLKFEGLRS